MITCVITDHTPLKVVARNLLNGVTWIQIREKDISARALFELVSAARRLPNPSHTKIIVNSRVDIAVAGGADGVHLPGDSPPPKVWRGLVPPGFLLGVSCHTVDEVVKAGPNGANYVLFGPVFAPLSKSSPLDPRGLGALAQAARSTTIPVLALGGITRENASSCIAAGAAGIAGISLGLTNR